MITAPQLVAHAIGDYVLQSDWMAQEKTQRHVPALAHALTYGLPFLLLQPSWAALAVIVGTHFVIDRWRLARYVTYIKNQCVPARHRYAWSEAQPTGYHESRPAWMTVWLMIVADNIMHVVINGAALTWL